MTTAGENIFIGKNAGYYCTSSQNVMVGGEGCGDAVTTGSECVFMGSYAGTEVTTGSNNVLIGPSAGANITTSNGNTFVGKDTGNQCTTGLGLSICLGYSAGKNQGNLDRQLYIARDASGLNSNGTFIYGTADAQLYQGSNSSTWYTTCDIRLKKNVTDSPRGLAEINQMRIANFEYRKEDEIDMSEFPLADNPKQVCLGEGKDGIQTGLIAQEIEQIMPECIVEGKFGTKTVSNDPITWALVNAVKELSAKVETLQSEINTLKGG